ncbi:hypothetical protein [Agromyces sp. SYSU T00194]|uniref:hypothetical protein n=1 Tax=Agromyces chitinivorans TaxID=3158560 RepID=UPI00339948DE
MPPDDDLDALRARRRALEAVVYGTPDGHASRAADELAEVLGRIAALERQADAATATAPAPPGAGRADASEPEKFDALIAGLGDDIDDTDASAAAGTDAAGAAGAVDEAAADDAPSAPGRRRGIRRLLLAGAAVVALVAWFAVTITPPTGPGLAIFEREQAEADVLPMAAFLAPSERETTRLVHEEFGYGFWAFRDRSGRVCLIMLQPGTIDGADADCAQEPTFLAGGLSLVLAYEDIPDGLRPADMRMGEVLRLIWTADAAGVAWTMDADA